ncbi:MAG: hypothetical protein IJK37_07740, partial [Prevotella sp.]|nr:hypothetical protein [Prevotella sp.]
MARKKKDAEKSADVLALEARIRELELQNLALNTLIDVAEKNGIDIRKMTRVCRLIPNFAGGMEAGALWRLCASSREANLRSVFHGLGLRLGECQHFQENVNKI